MATIERTTAAGPRRRLLVGVGVLAAGAVALLVVHFARPPQMGADEEVFNAVDALFTAVTARDERLVGQCEQRLHALKGAGKLPDAAADYLDGILRTARASRWESAAETLYAFMSAQRREGPPDHSTQDRSQRASRHRKEASRRTAPGEAATYAIDKR